jgi:hypothetical protein
MEHVNERKVRIVGILLELGKMRVRDARCDRILYKMIMTCKKQTHSVPQTRIKIYELIN